MIDQEVIKNAKENYFATTIFKKEVIISPKRAKRPETFFKNIDEKVNQKLHEKKIDENCVFCLHNEHKTPRETCRIMNHDKNVWSCRSFTNYFPCVHISNNKAYGYHEVIVENPYHNKSLSNMTPLEIKNVLKLMQKRFLEIKNDKRIKFIAIFKNFGEKAGASQVHSHCQLIAIDKLPTYIKEISKMLNPKNCPFCKFDKSQFIKVKESKNSFILVPKAQMFSYELIIAPKKHKQFEDLSEEELVDLSSNISYVLKCYEKNFNNKLAYNMLFYTNPINTHQKYLEKTHFFVRTFLRHNTIAGFELLTNIFINTTNASMTKKLFK
ncbi:MAG: DUF4921 family protein [Candidatus Anstonellales archaeon]